jgi:hypothetical protein
MKNTLSLETGIPSFAPVLVRTPNHLFPFYGGYYQAFEDSFKILNPIPQFKQFFSSQEFLK